MALQNYNTFIQNVLFSCSKTEKGTKTYRLNVLQYNPRFSTIPYNWYQAERNIT